MRIDPDDIAEAVLQKAPGWARVGLTAPTPRLRREAAFELGRVIVEEVGKGENAADPAQLDFPV